MVAGICGFDEQHDGAARGSPRGRLAAVGGRVRASRVQSGWGHHRNLGEWGRVYMERRKTQLLWRRLGELFLGAHQDDAGSAVALDELDALIQVPLYVFSANKGFILFRRRPGQAPVSRYNLTPSADACFTGGRWGRWGGGDGHDGVAGGLVPRMRPTPLNT